MIRLLVKIGYTALIVFIILGSIVAFLLSTTPGLHTVINLSRLYLPGTLSIQHLQGSLLNNFSVEDLRYQNKTINIKIKQLNVQWHPETLKKHLLKAQWHHLQGELSKDQQLNSPIGTISATTTFPEIALNINSTVDSSTKAPWQITLSLLGTLPWHWSLDANLSQIKNAATKYSGLHADLIIRGVTKTPDQGTLALTIQPGYYQVLDNTSISELYFKGGTINVALSPKGLSGTGLLVVDQNKNLKLEFQLPQFALDTGLQANQKINGELTLEVNSLDFLQHINSEINKLKGRLVASIKANGTVEKPNIVGQLVLRKTSFYVPKLGLNIDTTDLNVTSKDKRWEATGSIISAGHHLSIKGTGTLEANYQGDVFLEATNFPLIKTSEYQINSSPQLKLHVTPTERIISGSILIPDAQIKPQTFSSSIALPDEVVYKKQLEQSPAAALSYTMDVAIKLGENVNVNVKGLKGHLEGALNIKQQPQTTLSAYGELSVRDGTYKAYGQELTIKQGKLIFTGGPIDNPGINLRATKKINNSSTYTNASQLFNFNSTNLQNVDLGDHITLGVEVTGRLTKPQIQLFSDPAILSQADILSMLILGRPANQANKAGGQLILAAISSMNLGGTKSTQLLDQLKQSSGLDFNIQTNTNYNQLTNTVTDSTAVVVGKSLSKRVYLSYNVGLSQTDPNVMTLKYILNKFFSIQISNSDTNSAIDFLYTSNKNKVKK
ncbi:translocation/assembly module TamB domain-containing protein [Legionella sp.]|uniref:translocation/assembly module TamB domain-containing protein n=1 Tax=Legionella sp. TaxID=459 RepID=UPI003C87266E